MNYYYVLIGVALILGVYAKPIINKIKKLVLFIKNFVLDIIFNIKMFFIRRTQIERNSTIKVGDEVMIVYWVERRLHQVSETYFTMYEMHPNLIGTVWKVGRIREVEMKNVVYDLIGTPYKCNGYYREQLKIVKRLNK